MILVIFKISLYYFLHIISQNFFTKKVTHLNNMPCMFQSSGNISISTSFYRLKLYYVSCVFIDSEIQLEILFNDRFFTTLKMSSCNKSLCSIRLYYTIFQNTLTDCFETFLIIKFLLSYHQCEYVIFYSILTYSH